jgi:NAD(P)-dependent dehydrogenase (short-subunit alcohol dehydrogenase family)
LATLASWRFNGFFGSAILITSPSPTLTSSPHARLPFKGAIDYNTAKAGAHQLALSAGNELMWHGIRVNLIEPGWTDTPGEWTWYTDEVMSREGGAVSSGLAGHPRGHRAGRRLPGLGCRRLCGRGRPYG